ncbi:MAG: hypothetical protein AAGF20_02500 [Pseudomonadota bacterium]
MNNFSFDSAAFHFSRTDGPSGFIWKYVLFFCVGSLALFILSQFFLSPIIAAYVEMIALSMQGATEEETAAVLINAFLTTGASLIPGLLIMVLAGIAFWAMCEGAVQRRYMLDHGFSVRFGSDELRLLVVGLLWLVTFIGLYLIFSILAAILIGSLTLASGDNLAVLVFAPFLLAVLLIVVFAYVTIKLSPAAALTVRDQRIQFFGAWGATKGRFWTMFGAFLVLAILLSVGTLILYFIIGMASVSVLFGAPGVIDGAMVDPEALAASFASPSTLIILAIIYFILTAYQAFSGYVWAGVAARAAKTDPRGGGQANAATIFD